MNFHKGRQPRNPSQTNGTANVRINSEIAIPKLQELAHRYIGIIDAKGFLDDLRIALGIPNAKRVSKYGEIVVPKDDGSILKASLRITNHQANAGQHIKNNANYDYNLSIVVRRRARKNTFIPHNDVKLDEYVYYGKNISKVENPLTQIINSIIGFLQTGVYKGTTGVALKNTSPTNENKEYKTNEKMKNNLIRLTESELKQIVAESVKKVLSEIGDTPKGQFALGAVRGRASARPRYQNSKYGGLYTQSRQDSIANNAADASWEKRKDLDINKNREMKNAEERGYYYGFKKGMTN